jgi:hypothetical protein
MTAGNSGGLHRSLRLLGGLQHFKKSLSLIPQFSWASGHGCIRESSI